MEKEIWKVYKKSGGDRYHKEKVYEVSNLGRVKLNGKIVEPGTNGSYLAIGAFYIHRAVAELFVPNPENKPCVDHINTDPLDNRACNLRWVTHKENSNNPLTKQHYSEANIGRHHSEETKRKISEAHKGKPHSEEAKRKMSAARKGKTNGSKGKHWKVIDGKRVWY